MPRIVVVGVGTGVGKTHLTARLARELATGARALALKPIETGFVDRRSSDAAALEAAALAARPPHPLWTAAEPCAPAAARRGDAPPLDLDAVETWVRQQEHYTTPHYTLIETAGGLLTPLGSRSNNADLAARLGPDLILLAAPNRLGCLHLVATALAALRDAGTRSPVIALTAPGPPDASGPTNASLLRARHPHLAVHDLAMEPRAFGDLCARLRALPPR